MIPSTKQLIHIDSSIRPLIVNLARIPRVQTLSNCECHIYGDRCPVMPVKPGWFHVIRGEQEHNDIFNALKRYCVNSKGLFQTRTAGGFQDKKLETVESVFESYETINSEGLINNLYLHEWNFIQRREYISRAQETRRRILNGWGDMNSLVTQYIRINLRKNPEDLSFRNPKEPIVQLFPSLCCH